eukprot:332786_1
MAEEFLHSQQLLDQSITCINNGMNLENNNKFQQALDVYETGISLLTKAKQIETNTEVLPIIKANLENIQKRIASIRSQIQYDSMVTNIQQMQQKSIDLLNEYTELSEQHEILNNKYDELKTHYNNHNITSTQNIQMDTNDDTDELLTNLYNQYCSANYNYNDNENENEKENEIEIYNGNENENENENEYKYEIIPNESLLIELIPNDITGYIFEFISGRDLTKLFIISKLWFNVLLYDSQFSHLWKRVIIGADPISNSLGHNLKLKWIKTTICGTQIRSLMETLIISTAGLALDALLQPISHQDLYILKQYNFPKLNQLIFYGWSDLNVLSLKNIFKNNLCNLTSLYMESTVDVLDICLNLKYLRILQCNVINCNNLQLIEKHQFKNIIYIS